MQPFPSATTPATATAATRPGPLAHTTPAPGPIPGTAAGADPGPASTTPDGLAHGPASTTPDGLARGPASATPAELARALPGSYAPGTDGLRGYWRFYWAVASTQLLRWLPDPPARVLDLSGVRARSAAQAAGAGHTVLAVVEQRADGRPGTPPALRGPVPGRLAGIRAELCSLDFLAPSSVDAVVADDRVLSRQLVTETIVAEIVRVLRPGGRLFACVDSLVLGMARLAERHCWAELSDVPSAEVVLVPWPDGTLTRCFGAEQLRELLTDAGLTVEWIKPRTVLSPSTVELMLRRHPRVFARLVQAELAADVGDESVGIHLVASARKRP